MKIGVLALQGSISEHIKMLNEIENINGIEVKKAEQLNEISGLILPGGESTTIQKLLNDFNLMNPLKEKIKNGMPVWGTCAGLILLAKNVVEQTSYLNAIDITVKRNAYGRQINSFEKKLIIKEFSKEEIPLVFIRAPWIESVGKNVKILCEIDGHIVAAREKNVLVTSFHPELTNDLSIHKYFIEMCR